MNIVRGENLSLTDCSLEGFVAGVAATLGGLGQTTAGLV